MLPIVSAIAYNADAILFVILHNFENDKQRNYAGLLSTLLILFYYLQYDVQFNLTHCRLYLLYQFLLWILVFSANVLYVYYYHQMLHRPLMAYIFVCYGIIDTVWIIIIGYLKFKGYHQHMFVISMENLFHLIAMVGQFLVIFIPIFGSHEVITNNSMAFFILYEFFALSYTNMLNLKYSRLTRLCFWLLLIFSTIAVAFEYFVYTFEQRAEEIYKDNYNITTNETQSSSSSNHYTHAAEYFDLAKEIGELLATLACYSMLI